MELFENINYFYIDRTESLLSRYPEMDNTYLQDFYMIIFCEAASGGKVTCDDQIAYLGEERIIVLKPGSVVNIQSESKISATIICFTEDFFSLSYNQNVIQQFGLLKRDASIDLRQTEKQAPDWNVLLSMMLSEFQGNRNDSYKVLRSYLNIVLFQLERLYNPMRFTINNKYGSEKIAEFEHLIDQYFKIKKLPSEYAELMNVTPNYLNKLCKDLIGMTAGEVIRKRIILEAKRLLYHTNDTIFEIADKLGFENTTYFITYFKKYTQHPPEQFRKIFIL